MEQAGIYRGAAQANEKIASAYSRRSERQTENKNTGQSYCLAQTYHIPVGYFHGKKTADKTAEGDPEIEQGSPLGSFFRRDSSGKYEIAASPQPCRGFQGTIAEEAEQGRLGPGKLYYLGKRKGGILCFLFRRIGPVLLFFPQRK